MGKPKKGKKDNVEDEKVDSDIETNPESTNLNSDDNTDVAKKSAKESKKEKKKTGPKKEVIEKESDIESDEDDEVEALAKDVKKNLTVTAKGKEKAKPKVKPVRVVESSDDDDLPQTKGKTAAPMGFALLGMDDDDDDDSASDQEPVQKQQQPAKTKKQPAKKPISVEKEEDKSKSKKSKKSKKKRGDSDEEDLDAMLAELEAEYAGVKKEQPDEVAKAEPEGKKDKKGKKEKKTKEVEVKPTDDAEDKENGETQMKSAADKRKEKKERQKKEAALLKEQEKKEKEEAGDSTAQDTPVPETMVVEEPEQPETVEAPAAETDDKKKKKKDKDGKAAKDAAAKKEEEDSKKKKGPNQKVVAAMQERLRLIKEEEERIEREQEEKIRILEEADRMKLEQERMEKEKKEMKKIKQKERKEQLKAEGKLLTAKQKNDRFRAQAMLDAMRAQGMEIPDPTQKKHRPGTRVRPKKERKDSGPDSSESKREGSEETKANETVDAEPVLDDTKDESEDDVKEAWDAISSSEDEPEPKPVAKVGAPKKTATAKTEETESSDEDSDDSDDEGSDDDESSEEDEDDRTDAEKMRQRALDRIAKRTQDAEKKRDPGVLRAGVVCVLGHVDTGKTKILDKLRKTNVQDGEAGGITQQIGATNVPIDNIREQTKFVKGYADSPFKLPGLLIIDTPGHESFSNLRSRGSSLCDLAILVVDIMHGIEPQTLESINLLKSRKTPFVIALNKIDRLYDWQTIGRKDIRDVFRAQAANTQLEFKKRTDEVIVQFAEQSLNAALFYENPDPRTYVSMVPTSAITGEGMGNLLFLISQYCQNQLAKKLMYSDDLQATVLEVKAIPGLGTTIDAILINGKLREGDTMILAGTEGPIVTQIKALLMPQPMKELRVKNAYVEHKEITAAQGVKIAAKDLEKAIAGLNLQIAHKPDEVEIFRDIVARELKSVLSSIKLSTTGVYVQASTLGSLEALLEFLRTSKIPYCGIRIGPVVKRDVMKASTMLEHESQYATILAFDVKIERDAQDLADHLGVKIFQADIIYHLFDKFMAYRNELKARKRDEFKSIAVFPCKLKVLPQYIFNSRDPIVVGVMVEAGVVKNGTPICVPSKEFVEIGVVTSVEINHKSVETARKGQEVCLKIEPIPGDAPKMFGRHFDETDMLVSKISRLSIDACKDYFRDDLVKADWDLMRELKKTFEIL